MMPGSSGEALRGPGWKTWPVLRRTKRSKNLPDAPVVPEDTAGAEGDDEAAPDVPDGDEADAVEVDPTGDEAEGGAPSAADPDDDRDRDHDSDGADDDAALPRPRVEQLSDARLLFDCIEWSRDDRAALDAALGERSIDRVWQGPELVVGMLDEHLVEEAFDDLGVGQAHLSDGADQVVYEVGEWPRVLRDSLAESLLVAGIACAWDEAADLHVSASDEDAVDAIVEAMPDPDEVFEEAEGTEVQDLLTQLYAAVDRLKDNPKIPGARLDVVEAADRMDRLAVPFGFDAHQWRDLVERAVDLRDEIDADVAAAAARKEAEADEDDPAGDDPAGDDPAGAATGSDDDPPGGEPDDDGSDDEFASEDDATGTTTGSEDGEEPVDDDDEPSAVSAAPAKLPFAARAGQLRDRLVRLV